MKKFILFLALAGAMSAFADDSFIYWMIDPAGTLNGGTLPESSKVTAKISAFSGSSEWVYGGGEYLNIYNYDYDNATVGNQIGPDVPAGYGVQYFANIIKDNVNYGNGYTYFLELYNDNGIFARSEGLGYSAESVVTLAGMQSPGKLWTVASFSSAAVPEPNSAVLLMLGCAVMALRRRKMVRA